MNFVLIISRDEDFAVVLSEQITRQLKFECRRASDESEAADSLLEASLVVTDGVALTAPCPVLVLGRARAPLHLQSVLEEIEALLSMPAQELKLAGGYRFLPRLRQMLDSGGKAAEFTDREAGLLMALAQAGEEGLARDALLKQVWGFDSDINTHTLETHIYRLRGKIRETFGIEMIEATQGGYRLEL